MGASLSRPDADESTRSSDADYLMQPSILEQDVVLGATLGEGSFGIVRRGTWLGMPVAVKSLAPNAASADPCLLRSFQGELEMLSSLRHPNIISLLGHYESSHGGLHIVMQLGQGSSLTAFLKRMHSSIPLPSTDALSITLDICRGVLFLHTQNPPVAHCDLKSPNIILFEGGMAKIADFGIARRVRNSIARVPGDQGVLGSLQWMAPENADELSPAYGRLASDIYSLAMIMWELAQGTGEQPWEQQTMMYILTAIRNGQRPVIAAHTPPPYAALIRECWQQNPELRPPIRDVVERLSMVSASLCRQVEGSAFSALHRCELRPPAVGEVDSMLLMPNEVSASGLEAGMVNRMADEGIRESRLDPVSGGAEVSINALVETLMKGSSQQQEEATLTLMGLAHVSVSNQELILQSGAVGPLIRMLRHGSDFQKEQAAAALGALAFRNRVNQEALREAGIVTPLVLMIKEGTNTQKVHASDVVRNFARKNIENQDELCAAGVVPSLVSLLLSGNDVLMEHAAGALRSLAYKNRAAQDLIRQSGAIDALVTMTWRGNESQREQAAGALRNLAFKNSENQRAMIATKAIEALVALASNGTDAQQLQAAGALRALAANSLTNQIAIYEAGAIEALVSMVRSGKHELMRQAAGALGNLASNNRANQEAIRAAGAIAPLVALARNGTKAARVFAASALWSLAFQNLANQKALRDAGGVEPLVDMARAGTKVQKVHAARALLTLACQDETSEDSMSQTIEPLVAVLTLSFKQLPALLALKEKSVRGPRVNLQRNRGEAIQVTGALFILILGHTSSRDLHAAMEPLVALMLAGTELQKEEVVGVLWNLAWDNAAIQDAARLTGVLHPLVSMMQTGSAVLKYLAAGAVWNLVANNLANQDAMREARAIEQLVSMLRCGSEWHQEQAAGALGEIVANNPSNQSAALDAVHPLVEMLGSRSAAAKEYAAFALANLAAGHERNKREIVSAGATRDLLTLAQDGTDEQRLEAVRALSALAPMLCTMENTQQQVEPILVKLSRAGTDDQRFWAAQALLAFQRSLQSRSAEQ